MIRERHQDLDNRDAVHRLRWKFTAGPDPVAESGLGRQSPWGSQT